MHWLTGVDWLPMMHISYQAVILHMWERGGGMFLAAVKYKSFLSSAIHSMHHMDSEESFLRAALILRRMEL